MDLDVSQFEFMPQLTAALHKLVGDPTQSNWSLDSLKPDSPEMDEFRKAIEAAKAQVIKAKEYHDSLPGIELSPEQQQKELELCEEELRQKRAQLEKYKALPIFQQLNHQE